MKKVLLLLALALGALAAAPTVTQAAPLSRRAALGVGRPGGLYQPLRYGPYLTLARADQVAAYFRVRGYRAQVVVTGVPLVGPRRFAVVVARNSGLRYAYGAPW